MERQFFCICVFALLFACTPVETNSNEPGGGKDGTVHVTGVSLDKTSLSLKQGESAQLNAIITPANATDKSVTWKSDNTGIATVEDGKVTAIKDGTTVITVTTKDGGKTATCNVAVQKNLDPAVTVGTDKLSAVSVVLKGKANLGSSVASDIRIGFQYSKSAGILPSNSTTVDAQDADSDYNYTTVLSVLEPATKYYFRSFVRQNGQDTYGETKEFTTKEISSILETLDATGVESTSAILNAKLDLTDVKYESLEYGFYLGKSATSQNVKFNGREIKENAFSVCAAPLPYKTKYWYKSFVMLDSQTFYGDVKTFTTDFIKVESISLNKTEYTFYAIGNTLTINATILPADASERSLEWSSDNESVATVDKYGKVTAKDNGTATINVSALDGSGVKATCKIEVRPYVTSITLGDLDITVGEQVDVPCTITPSNAYNTTLTWSSDNTTIVEVAENGMATAKSEGKATITASANDGSGVTATCNVVVSPQAPEGAVYMGTHTADGFRLYWATSNLSSSGLCAQPEDYGDYYAWGEVESKEEYSWTNYKFRTSGDHYDNIKFSKYNTKDSYGDVDNKTVLDPEDDAAHVILGGKWRMPTIEEWTELISQCKWTQTTQNGVNGRLVTASNGNSIFLPNGGYREFNGLWSAGILGMYWSPSISINSDSPVWGINYLDGYDKEARLSSEWRYRGLSIRPVVTD